MATVRVTSVVPSRYCPPEFDEVEAARRQQAVAPFGRPVVDDGAVAGGGRDRREARPAVVLTILAEGGEAVRGIDFAHPPARRFSRQPGEEADERGAVAAVRGTDAGALGRALRRFGQLARIGAGRDDGAGLGEAPDDPLRRAVGIDADAPAGGAEAVDHLAECRRIEDDDAVSEVVGDRRLQLTCVAQQRHRGVGADDGKDEGQRRIGHVAAADVEQPGDRVRLRQHGGVLALATQLLGDSGALVGRRGAGEGRVVNDQRRQRRRRPVRPDPIDGVVGDRRQPAAGAHRRRLQRPHLRRRVQPRIEAEAAAPR